MADHVLLIGMMGAGKTTVGQLLADRLGWERLDSDEQVRARTGMTIPEIFRSRGEAAFRAEEKAALAAGLSSPRPVVVSVAGGAVLDPDNRKLIRQAGRVVWLRADPATLTGRVGRGEGRPLLDDDPGAALVRLDAIRRPLYAELADLAIDVDRSSPAAVVDQIIDWMGSTPPGPGDS